MGGLAYCCQSLLHAQNFGKAEHLFCKICVMKQKVKLQVMQPAARIPLWSVCLANEGLPL